MNKSRIATLVALLVLAVVPCACVDEESDLGVNLVDHGTLYNGHTDTIFATAAYSSTDDSLLTSDYTFGIIGNYADPVFGFVSSTLYTQIALSSTDNSITTEDMVIDSAVLSLVNDVLFPDSTATYSFHFEVRHLAEPLADTFYYSTDAIEVDGMAPLYDGTLQVLRHPHAVVVAVGMVAAVDARREEVVDVGVHAVDLAHGHQHVGHDGAGLGYRHDEFGVVYHGAGVLLGKGAHGAVEADVHLMSRQRLEVEALGAVDVAAGGEDGAGVVVLEVGEVLGTHADSEVVVAVVGVAVVVDTQTGVDRGEVDGHHARVGAGQQLDTQALGKLGEVLGGV